MSVSQKLTRLIDWFYVEPFRRIMSVQKFRYAACGGANLLLNWLLYYISYHAIYYEVMLDLGFVVVSPYIATLVTVFPITFLTGFWLQGHISFRSSPLKGHVRLLRYLVSVGGSLVLSYLFVKFFVEAVRLYPTVSNILSSLLVTVYSYFMQKYYSFRGCLDE